MGLIILRLIFIMVASAIGVTMIRSCVVPPDNDVMIWAALGGMIALALCVIGIDVAIRRKQLDDDLGGLLRPDRRLVSGLRGGLGPDAGDAATQTRPAVRFVTRST